MKKDSQIVSDIKYIINMASHGYWCPKNVRVVKRVAEVYNLPEEMLFSVVTKYPFY